MIKNFSKAIIYEELFKNKQIGELYLNLLNNFPNEYKFLSFYGFQEENEIEKLAPIKLLLGAIKIGNEYQLVFLEYSQLEDLKFSLYTKERFEELKSSTFPKWIWKVPNFLSKQETEDWLLARIKEDTELNFS